MDQSARVFWRERRNKRLCAQVRGRRSGWGTTCFANHRLCRGDAFTRARRLARRARRAHRRAMLAANISAMSGAATLGSPVASARARRAASPRVASPVAGTAVSASAFRTSRRLAGASHPRASPSRARRGLGVFAQATQDDGAASLAVPEDDSIQVRPTPGRTRSARPMRRPRISILFTSVRFPPT